MGLFSWARTDLWSGEDGYSALNELFSTVTSDPSQGCSAEGRDGERREQEGGK